MKEGLIMGKLSFVAFGIILIIGLIGIGWYVNGLDRVVKMDEAVKASWAQVENQLQRRNDLIPNLVNTVKGYASHEEGLFTKITELRSQWAGSMSQKDKIKNAEEMGRVLSRLLLVAENYPELKANENFLTLQAQLEGTENRISVERMRYNESVRTFNAHIRTVFGKFFAKRRALTEPAPYFEISEEVEKVPEVKF